MCITYQKEVIMTHITPFTVTISDDEITELRRRLDATRWPSTPKDESWDRGVPLGYLQDIVSYWSKSFDWRKVEAKINNFPQFTTTIDGQTIHFIHSKSSQSDASPILLCHGYPGSVIELLDLVQPLNDAGFDVVVPSMPGLGFSTPVTKHGWETSRTAKAYAELMDRLGYTRYGVQGSDVGSGICNELCLLAPDKVIGAHVSTDPSAVAALFDLEKVDDSGLDAKAKKKLDEMRALKKEGYEYLKIQGTRPQTIGYGFTDSPVLQLAWIVEKVKEWANDAAQLPEDDIAIDTLLANVSVYWFTKSGASSAHMIYDSQHAQGNWGMPTVPMGFAIFNATPVVRLLLDPSHQHAHWSEFKEGGHFPGMEAPKQLAKDIVEFFASLGA